MRIIISPAKKMRLDADSLAWKNLPQFLPQTKILLTAMRGMDAAALKQLWKCNDPIAELNIERLQEMDLTRNLTPAILAYEGIQYQYMAPNVFTQQEFDYIEDRLRILSGFYGLLKPFDGVTPYRLEMQAKLKTYKGKDLYAYWNFLIAEQLFSESDCILNLASKEYSVSVSRYLKKDVRFITCVFGEEKDGKIIEKGTMCKMARGEMVRFMAQHQLKTVEEIKDFDRLGYRFDPSRSDDITYIFVKEENAACSLD